METLIHLLTLDEPPPVRVLACLALALGRFPTWQESGLPRSTFYAHAARARAVRDSDQLDPDLGHRSGSRTLVHSGAKFSTGKPPALARAKPSADPTLADQDPRDPEFSTAQKKKNLTTSPKEAAKDAPLNPGGEASALNALREAHAAAVERGALIPQLECSPEALSGLRQRIAEHGAPYVVAVALSALRDAERRQIPGAWWSRIFVGAGFEARACAHDAREAKDRSPRAIEIATLIACGVKA